MIIIIIESGAKLKRQRGTSGRDTGRGGESWKISRKTAVRARPLAGATLSGAGSPWPVTEESVAVKVLYPPTHCLEDVQGQVCSQAVRGKAWPGVGGSTLRPQPLLIPEFHSGSHPPKAS